MRQLVYELGQTRNLQIIQSKELTDSYDDDTINTKICKCQEKNGLKEVYNFNNKYYNL